MLYHDLDIVESIDIINELQKITVIKEQTGNFYVTERRRRMNTREMLEDMYDALYEVFHR